MTRSQTENVKDKVMTGEEYPLIIIAEASQPCVKVHTATTNRRRYRRRRNNDHDNEAAAPLLHRLSSFHNLKPNFGKLRSSLRKLNCFKSREEEQEIPVMEVQRHKSFDIGVGLARRMSLFLFTKKTACVHPYHPFTPTQTTRKFYVFPEDKH